MNSERHVFCQERANGAYLASAYYIVKFLFDSVPLRALNALITGATVYYLAGLQDSLFLFGHLIGILIMFNIITGLICLTIAAVIPNQSLANLVAIVFLLFLMLFQGAMINLQELPGYVAWITFISPFRFAYNSLMVNEFDGLVILFDPYEGMEVRFV